MYITEAYTIVGSVRNRESLPAHITPKRFAEAKAIVETALAADPKDPNAALYRRALRGNAKMGR